MKPFTPLLVLALLALPGCKQDAKQAKATGGTAAGEVLPGSASDAMIPIDTLRSQPPAAPRSESGGESGKPGDKSRKAAHSAATPTAAPAETSGPAEPATPEG